MTKRNGTVANAIERAVETAAMRPDVAIANVDASRTADQLTSAILKTPELQFAANTEPWYQSPVTIGASIALISGLYSMGYDFTDGTIPTPSEFVQHATVVGGNLFVLWGRWFAKRPLGQ